MRRALKSLILTAAVAVVWAPVSAHADGYVSPWGGVNFGSDIGNGRAAVGVNAGFMGAGILGAEAAFGYSPHFFGSTSDFGSNTVIDLMGNLVLGIPIGGTHGAGVRPYVSGGAGLIRTQIDHSKGIDFHPLGSNNDFGWDAGVGITGYMSSHFGLRGDMRYFKDQDSPSFHYWRLSGGIVIR
jgi:Outer membrane protein beta-barrel domain